MTLHTANVSDEQGAESDFFFQDTWSISSRQDGVETLSPGKLACSFTIHGRALGVYKGSSDCIASFHYAHLCHNFRPTRSRDAYSNRACSLSCLFDRYNAARFAGLHWAESSEADKALSP